MATLRPYRRDDAPALLALFRDTIRRVNSRDYSPAQIAAWASDDIDTVTWFGRFTGRFVPVAEEAGRPVGFAELEPDGHIDRVYVSADHQRRGIGRQLLDAVVAEARRVGLARLFTEASITARPFFEAQGFVVLAPQVVMCRGAEFVNYRMERVLAEPSVAEATIQAEADGNERRTSQLVLRRGRTANTLEVGGPIVCRQGLAWEVLMAVDLLAGTDKQIAYTALQRMPESATLDEISEELAILAAIRRGEAGADAGQTLTHAEVKQRSATWTGK